MDFSDTKKTDVLHVETVPTKTWDDQSDSELRLESTSSGLDYATDKHGMPIEEDIFVTKEQIPDSLKDFTTEQLEELSRKTRKKMDLRILIMVCWIYICNYLDRTNIATARLGGLEEDLNITNTQYQTAISILFVGYITMQIPCNIILNRLGRPSLFITVIMTAWGIVSTCTGAVQDYGGLLAVRILLGFVESGFFGCCLYYLSCWYTKKELALRNSILYSGSLISGAFSGLISAGIIEGMDGLHGLRAWRWCFIIMGALTCGTVPLAYVVLPDNPSNTKFLSQQERDIVMWKLKMDVGDSDDDDAVLGDSKNSFMFAMKLALKDLKVWMITGCISLLVAAAGVTNFFPSVVQTLNFSRIVTLCLTAPPYCIAVFTTFIWAWHSDRTGERFYHVVLPLLVALMAFIIAVSTLNTGARYFAMCLIPTGLYCSYTIIISWISLIVPRPPLKRAIAISIMNCLANSTSIWNPYLYPEENAPRYVIAFSCNCGFIAGSIALACVLRIYLRRLNQKIDNGTMNWFREFGNDGSHIKSSFRYMA
ncbi:hypothetical protein Kpol_455p12 [Vanderwaltozyma polyspora DSM 70294]|uniref:Major facilitator superfamily (MFS) profile domain-containing protein n=1 Tax=Vanderwaltozyma polyspora (strain ATCC 22028 / DSM 70294 / BCRC 21397 / CBS 2163 / NBRC 10782 / NRRL Y-8283 / UCD 57-17) TaxID=436907 RepID=A7TR33_VANPO|nr:uncharacterized protein Kpol_455p12 [Vanderwaltozyma polyspora DSM 70294]EDO15281.1 hypothetical protein Kpol_455p12 [Vanderwaltozyma polyspora DSM 70294]